MTTSEIAVPEWAVKGELIAYITRPTHMPERVQLAEITGVGKRYLTVKCAGPGKPERFDMERPETDEADGTVWLRRFMGYSGSTFIGPRNSIRARRVQEAQNLRAAVESVRRLSENFVNVQSDTVARELITALEHWRQMHTSGAS